mgnify:CR=1 FL=1
MSQHVSDISVICSQQPQTMGRAGTSLTAEIGLMKAGEQISVMEMMAVDPIARVIGGILIGAAMLGVGMIADWDHAMITLSIMTVAVVLALVALFMVCALIPEGAALLLAYDGGPYKGFQPHPTLPTVGGVLAAAFHRGPTLRDATRKSEVVRARRTP